MCDYATLLIRKAPNLMLMLIVLIVIMLMVLGLDADTTTHVGAPPHTFFYLSLAESLTYFTFVSQFADFLTDFPVLDADLQRGSGIYPGEDWCNPQEPHAKVNLYLFFLNYTCGSSDKEE